MANAKLARAMVSIKVGADWKAPGDDPFDVSGIAADELQAHIAAGRLELVKPTPAADPGADKAPAKGSKGKD